jgi:hypothetical protein
MRIAIIALLLLSVVGCGGHSTLGTTAMASAAPTLNGYTGVYLSTVNAWGKPTLIRILVGTPTSVQFVGNAYGSLGDAQAVATASWQPNTGNFVGQVTGTISYTDPNSAASAIEMSIAITDPSDQANDLPMRTGSATFGSAPRDPNSTAAWIMTEAQPSATWAEIG